MKKFEKPEMEVIVFEAEDIITTSGETSNDSGPKEDEANQEDDWISTYDLNNSMLQKTTDPTTEPATDPTTEPATDPTTEPATELATEPTTEPTTETTTEPEGV